MSSLRHPFGWISGVFLILAVMRFLPFLDLPFKGAYPALWLFLSMAKDRCRILSSAFLLCALGDVMGIMGHFPLQVGSFALSQMLFIFLFVRNSIGRPIRKARKIAVLLLWMVMLPVVSLVIARAGGLFLASLVLAYVLLLLSMASCAILLSRWTGMAGALLFVLSDTMIGIRNFVMPFPFSAEAIMGTYYAALLLLCFWFFTKSRPRDAVW